MAYTTIDKPTDYFNTVLYTGNGSSNSRIQELVFNQIFGLKEDLQVIQIMFLYDHFQEIQKILGSNSTDAETTDSN
jgi:hypothetical protein